MLAACINTLANASIQTANSSSLDRASRKTTKRGSDEISLAAFLLHDQSRFPLALLLIGLPMRHALKHSSRFGWGAAACSALTSLWMLTGDLVAAEPVDYLGRSQPHRLLSSDMPPGALGQARLAGRGPIAGYYQPVALKGPEGLRFAFAENGTFSQPTESLHAGLLIGGVYRFQLTYIPGAPGAELYPTIEVIDRTYPPPGLATRYPIVIDLDQQDLEAAMAGQLVTRVIYLEDPQTATPLVQTPTTMPPIDIPEYQDALEVADQYGRPVAIVRIGSVSPPQSPQLKPQFFFGYPTWAPIDQPEPTQAQE